MSPEESLNAYADDAAPQAATDTTREEMYYPSIRTLVQRLLGDLNIARHDDLKDEERGLIVWS